MVQVDVFLLVFSPVNNCTDRALKSNDNVFYLFFIGNFKMATNGKNKFVISKIFIDYFRIFRINKTRKKINKLKIVFGKTKKIFLL